MSKAFEVMPTVQHPCDKCKSPMTIYACWLEDKPVRPIVCQACKRREERLAVYNASSQRFREIKPFAFRDTALHLLPCDQSKVKQILDWEAPREKPIMILHGVTGRGKTRMMWQVLESLAINNQLWPKVWGPGEISAAITDAWRDYMAAGIVNESVKAGVLAFDDLDKDRFTPRAEEAIFRMIADRCDHGRPTIITTNLTGPALLAKFSAEMAPALGRRLAQYSTAICL